MQVQVNDNAIEVNASAGLRVGDLIDALGVHVKSGDIVSEVEVDGVSYVAGDSKLAWLPVEESSRLRLKTVSGRALGEGLRADVIVALEVLRAKTLRTSELLERGESVPAQVLLGELLEELRLTLVLDAQSSELAGVGQITSAQAFEAVGMGMVAAQEDGDRTKLGQLLSQTLEPMLGQWSEAGASPK